MALIYKIHPESDWLRSEAAGVFDGAPVDLEDGFIHFSTGAQLAGTAEKHFAGREGLLLVAVEADALGEALKWEPSRGGELFPHLYGPLAIADVRWIEPLRLGADGRHLVPADLG